MPARDLLHRARNSTIMSAAASPVSAPKVNSHWLGPSSISSERNGKPSAVDVLAQHLQDRVDLIEARFGQVLETMRDAG